MRMLTSIAMRSSSEALRGLKRWSWKAALRALRRIPAAREMFCHQIRMI